MNTEAFRAAYKTLNDEQRQAVDTIEGPVLVVAGPGTGKTQLLSARVANILNKTDIPAANILCLTFTESGATNMRERLSSFIGSSAYDVTISTYHALGADIIQRYPEYFMEYRLQQAVDELGRHQICTKIVESLSYKNPLKQTSHHINDLLSTLSELKRALLAPSDIRTIAKENLLYIENVNTLLAPVFEDLVKIPGTYASAEPYFTKTLRILSDAAPVAPANARYGSLAGVAITELTQALEEATAAKKSTPLTAWKNTWLKKNANNRLILNGDLANRRLRALADALEHYEESLKKRGLYDFDDMIIRAVHALEQHDDLRFTLQERYQYLLLDEFQDTNAAQLRLVELLTNNPLSEGRPNVMAVGDDDQAIYAFQGAQYSNMLDFYHLYRDVVVVNLHKNYRSHETILETAGNIATQINERLFDHFDGIEKQLYSAARTKNAAIVRTEFVSDVAERAGVAAKIHELIQSGVSSKEIVVLAPKHRYLTSLVPFLNHYDIPVHYEKRENILESPIIRRLVAMARLVIALQQGNNVAANALWPQILSGKEWNCSVSDIWNIAWSVSDSKGTMQWAQALLESNQRLRSAALLHLALAQRCNDERLEIMLDYLIGIKPIETLESDILTVESPLFSFYANFEQKSESQDILYETLSQLTVLRAKLREHQATQDESLRLQDLVELVEAYEAAGQPMLHTSPHHQSADAVQLMTVYKAKGLEFEHVFLLSCTDDVWGGAGKNNSNRITLPANLAPIRHSGSTEDERLRLFFVAVTRAKKGLYISSYASLYTGKATKRLKYLDERENSDGTTQAYVLPPAYRTVMQDDKTAPSVEMLMLNWQDEHIVTTEQDALRGLIQKRLIEYQLSPTHLNAFTDLIYGGPQQFFLHTILRFPSAPSLNSQFGTAMHSTLEWLQHTVTKSGTLPPLADTLSECTKNIKQQKLPITQEKLEIERGNEALTAYLDQRGHIFKPTDRAEVNFRHEGVTLGHVRMGGKIDRLEIDEKEKTIIVVDYKTGKSFSAWKSDVKLHKYKQQLYCYKLLVENSNSFSGYRVAGGRLEFIEPDEETHQIHTLEIEFKPNEEERTKLLLAALWNHVHEINFPNVEAYDKTLKGIAAFETDLLNGKI